MKTDIHISTEVIQLFSASEAHIYRLVPCLRSGNELQCYGQEGKDYSDTLREINVLFGFDVSIIPIPLSELDKMLNMHYRDSGGGISAETNGAGVSAPRTSGVTSVNDPDFVGSLIEEAVLVRSSDIHIEAYEDRCRVRMRIDGRLLERYVIDKAHYPALVNRIKILSNLDISEKRLPQDGRILFERNNRKLDVRVSSLPAIYGEKIVLRLLTRDMSLLDLKNLGFTPKQYDDYTKSVASPNGLILITGPTGSGKSTTLYATLRMLNREDNNVLTIEDPVEYTLEGINQVQLKEEIGLTFGNALRTFLRQDPDIIMLGEIRDHDTAEMAVRSSLTGHLLLSTIHTNSAWGSITRLADMGVHPWLISDTLAACVAQRLVRLLCPHCKQEYHIEEGTSSLFGIDPCRNYFKPTGCGQCHYTGYSGRKAIYEVIRIDNTLSEAIRQNRLNVENYLKEQQVTTLKDSALSLLAQGQTSLEEILPILNDGL
ncbi:GspE/PulE family protein [Bacteroides sp. UBA939]|uniref:GspE/PulE family protein n=1 Tax=Bacteroides sp. UBA939 TaxID=1946092 RepID=UPI0025C03661|nr:GspE/PulE family protein [Bacteroides sp. UBA939]